MLVEDWPNSLDTLATAVFLALAILVPALGYVFMVIDFRRYLRSLSRTLIRAADALWGVPEWAQRETPRAIATFGLRVPCTVEDLKHAYRRRVKQMHPDRGGDQRRFLLLQAHFEEALAWLSERSVPEAAAESTRSHAA